MGLKERLEKLEKELKGINSEQEGAIIIVTEYTQSEEDKRLIEKHEEEALKKLKDYPNAKWVIAMVDPKGWKLKLPEYGLEVKSNGEVIRYK